MKRYTFLLSTIFLFFVIPVTAQQVIQVNDGGSIQQAINSASDGDTVKVAAGTYDESLFINKNIILKGAGTFKTLLTGGDNGSRAYAENRTILVYSPVIIDGFTITQNSTDVDQNHNTMAILLEAAGNSIIRNCQIKNHITGIYISGSTNNTIENNLIEHCGNGVLFASFMFDSDQNMVQDNVIRNNGVADETDDAGVKLISNYTGNSNLITANDILENTIGVNNLTTNFIDAQGNWWGSTTGPNNSANPNGTGNSVSGFVFFTNWTPEENNSAIGIETLPSWKLGEVKMYPNPADINVRLAYDLQADARVNIKIIDLQGREVTSTQPQQLGIGAHQTILDTENLVPGFYLLDLVIDGESNLSRLVIR